MEDYEELERLFSKAKNLAKRLHDTRQPSHSEYLERCIWHASQGAVHSEILMTSEKTNPQNK